jgi:DNA (cytosine-5)-methyltransferase 1
MGRGGSAGGMSLSASHLDIADLFCGAGGSSIGIEAAGARLRWAANHWQVAIDTHATNFPHADHACVDICQADPRYYPRTTMLWASPSCTFQSPARTKPIATLFDPEATAMADRSRATMLDVVRFTERHRYELVFVENVVEAATRWELFDLWLAMMHRLGYRHEVVCLNSMVAHPTPQSRDRLYVVFWRIGNRAPDLRFEPRCWCPECRADVDGRQVWRDGRTARKWGKYRQQYDYRCPTCGAIAHPYAYPAASAIDWSLPAPTVGSRKKPLEPPTLRRIEIGLRRFGVPSFVTELRGGGSTARSAEEPMSTVTAGGNHHGLVVMPAAFYVKNYGPLAAAGPMAHGVDEPFGTVTTKDHHALVTMPFLTSYYGNGGNTPVWRPVPTLTTRDRHALVEPAGTVDECGYRMLEPAEQGAAMAFPTTYRVLGNKGQRTRQYGAAVTPPVSREIVARGVASLA